MVEPVIIVTLEKICDPPVIIKFDNPDIVIDEKKDIEDETDTKPFKIKKNFTIIENYYRI
jgi:hypothetical protein